MFAPANTPSAIIERVNSEVTRFVKTQAAKEKLLGVGLEAVGSSAQEFKAMIDAETATMSKVIRNAGIRSK